MERVPGTRVWYRTFKTPNDFLGGYKLLPNAPSVAPADLLEFLKLRGRACADPLNPSAFVVATDPEFPEHPLRGFRESALSLSSAPNHPELADSPARSKGALIQHRLRSRNLKNTRRVWTYAPVTDRPLPRSAPFIIFFDGFEYLHAFSATNVLDNLIRSRQIPPTVALFIDSRDLQTRERELPGYPPFGRFLVGELMPWARRTLGFSPLPSHTVLAGMSYGGLAGLYWSFRYPRLFQNVISQSGSAWWSPEGVDEPVWLAREFVRRPKLPLRIYMDVGRFEGESDVENGVGHLGSNRHLRDVLRMRGYPLFYQEYCGGHDFFCCRQTLVDALRWMLSKSRPRRWSPSTRKR